MFHLNAIVASVPIHPFEKVYDTPADIIDQAENRSNDQSGKQHPGNKKEKDDSHSCHKKEFKRSHCIFIF
jgi:hypothetical protein